jgi:hypothetical protein
MIIIEVARSFTRWEALLGEHRWSEVFQNPAPEIKDRVSQIFYCTKGNGRMVQKSGEAIVYHLCVPFDNIPGYQVGSVFMYRNHGSPDGAQSTSQYPNLYAIVHMFTHPYARRVTYPYPATHWCMVPVEDATIDPLCRNLPVKDFPAPQAEMRLPPGTSYVSFLGNMLVHFILYCSWSRWLARGTQDHPCKKRMEQGPATSPRKEHAHRSSRPAYKDDCLYKSRYSSPSCM